MPHPSSNGGPPFRLEISGAIRELILRLQRQASEQGRGELFIQAMEKLFNDLRYEAATVGEPLYNLPVMQVQVRATIVHPIALHYGVDFVRRIVYLKTVILLEQPKS